VAITALPENDKICPKDYVFLTNLPYGVNICEKNATEKYQEYVTTLQKLGFIVQVADATDVDGKYYSDAEYMHLAIYVKRADGKETILQDVWKTIDNEKKKVK